MIRIGILGYGNLGKGVELAIQRNPDMELVGIFTRRNPADIATLTGAPVFDVKALESNAMQGKIDVLVLCGGSATDLPSQTPNYAQHYNVVDSFDTHADINKHFDAVDTVATSAQKVALISDGWDPGLFSLARLQGHAILPQGHYNTFWGKGVSQGHSDAIRRIDGVKDARQYTIPVESALESMRSFADKELTTREKHTRECFVVVEEGADKSRIEQEIKTMPKYFADYDTTVHFISEEELLRDHSELYHGGIVMHAGLTGKENEHRQIIEYRLTLDSNPEFTGSVLVAYARAVHQMYGRREYGCFTVFDIRPADLSPLTGRELRAQYL